MSFVLLLEILVVFKLVCSFFRSLGLNSLLELLQNAVLLEGYLIKVVQGCVETGNDSAGIIEFAMLFLIVGNDATEVSRALLGIICLFESLNCNNDANYWLRQKCQQLLVEAEDFTHSPLLGHAHCVQIFCEDVWVALQRWPLKLLLLCCYLIFHLFNKILIFLITLNCF